MYSTSCSHLKLLKDILLAETQICLWLESPFVKVPDGNSPRLYSCWENQGLFIWSWIINKINCIQGCLSWHRTIYLTCIFLQRSSEIFWACFEISLNSAHAEPFEFSNLKVKEGSRCEPVNLRECDIGVKHTGVWFLTLAGLKTGSDSSVQEKEMEKE